MSKFLTEVSSGIVEEPYKIVLYGTEGVGKSTFASEAPNPIFMDIEGGTKRLNVKRMPRPSTFPEMLEAIDEYTEGKHDYQTIVLDTADWAESYIWKHVCATNNVDSIEDIGYGKGFTAALEHWRTLLARLDMMHEKRGMNIVVLAHAHIRSFRNPIGDDFERYELKLNNKASSLLKEWPHALLFARYQVFTHTDKQKRTRGVGDGSRVAHTQPHPAWDAKNRYNLPAEIPFPWGAAWTEFDRCARTGVPVEAEESSVTIEELMALAKDDVRVQAEAAMKRAGSDPIKLAKLADWLRGKVSKAA